MGTEASPEELREQLRIVEENLADLRRNAADLRQRVGDEEDPADRAGLITAAEEQERLIEPLESRRERLLRRLGQD
jgi:prefoldin subunit 5